MPRVVRSPDAIREIREIVDYIGDDNPFAAERWYRDLDHVFHLLSKHPSLGQRVKLGRRSFRRITRGSYVIYYRVLADTIEIAHVIHGARDHERLI